MVAGGKAQSAPFCLLSGLCHRAEGKSRAGRSLGSENRKAVGREKEVGVLDNKGNLIPDNEIKNPERYADIMGGKFDPVRWL